MIDPIAIKLGPIPIRWYGILISLALLLGIILALREVRRQNINEDNFLDILLWGIPAAFLGARAYYVIFRWDYYSQVPSEILAFWHGGLAIHGGIIGAFLAGYLVIRHHKMNFWQIGDIAAPSFILGQAIGRWGNFFNQEAYGYEVSPEQVPWAMWIDGAYRHPTFLYESVWNLLVFGFLMLIRRKKFIKEGEVLLLYFILYSCGRFVIEGFRTDSLMLGPLKIAQVISLVFIGVSILVFIYRRKKKQEVSFSK